jgi:CheY-like chemotaxis protein
VAQTLLLADDSLTIQRVIELTFADEDITVVAVSDGEQAIARLDTMPPDIVLADVGMPGKNGYDVAGHVKHTPHLAHIPVVLLTGAFEPVDQAKASALGCDAILAKPFEPQMVISRVKELLARPAVESPERARAAESAPATPRAPAPPPAPAAESASWRAPAESVPTREPVALVKTDSSRHSSVANSAEAHHSSAIVELKSSAPPAAAPAVNGDTVAKLDEYFDQLDFALERFTSEHAVKPADILPAVAPEAPPAELDWFGPPVVGEAAAGFDPMPSSPLAPSGLPLPDSVDLPRELRALQQATVIEGREPAATAESVEPPVPAEREPAAYTQATAASHPVAQLAAVASGEPQPVMPPAPRELPPLGDAFAAILAAEQSGPVGPSAWPAPPSEPAAPAMGEDVVDRVSRRVLEQLTDSAVRDAVADAVAGIAERLVREEIERIKKAIE